jgi:hypothetical protein
MIIALLGLSLICAPFLTSAQSTPAVSLSSVQEQIQTLLSKVAELQAKVNEGSSVSGVAVSGGEALMPTRACYAFSRSLMLGSKGDDVSALQQFLMDQGFTIQAGATGYFGPQTKAALVLWQVKNNIAMESSAGSGIFGPLSRGASARSCDAGTGGTSSTMPSSVYTLSADPQSGAAPLSVDFTVSAPITSSSTLFIDFGDKTESATVTPSHCIAIAAIVGGQGGIRCSATTTHTYASDGTYTARLMSDTCPKGALCFVGPRAVAETMIAVGKSTASTSKDIVKLNAPATTTLAKGGIAEIRNKNAYFTLTELTADAATIQVTGVGCWNSFPSDTPPEIRCMIAVMPIAPQTLTPGQTYETGTYSITLSKIENDTATFSIASR